MRKSIFTGLLVLAGLAVSTLAQAATTAAGSGDPGIPSSVLWIGGIAAGLAFFLGSFPPNRGDMAASEWDMQGSLFWTVAMGGIFGGGALYLNSGDTIGLIAAGFGALVGVTRLLTTRPPRVPKGAPLTDGINRAQGDSPKAKFKAAERAYNKASFQAGNSNRFATRAPRDWRYGAGGMAISDFTMLADSLASANSNTFDILLLLVRELPGEADQPAVIVVRGAAQLRTVTRNGNSFSIPQVGEIPAASIAGAIGYAWR